MDSRTGIALNCNLQGTIQQVVRDDLGLTSPDTPGQSLFSLLESACVDKAALFLHTLNEQAATFDWELNIRLEDQRFTLLFSGCKTTNALLIVASSSQAESNQFYQELVNINNEQTNQLRDLIKAQVSDKSSEDNTILKQFSGLNNELISIQRQMAKKNIQLEKLNQQKDQFLGMAAHDLRNPLNIISNYSDFLLEEMGSSINSEQRQFFTAIKDSSAFMLHLVEELLDIAQIESGKLTLELCPIDLGMLIKNTVQLNNSIAAKKHIRLQFSRPQDLPILWLDPHKINQVLNNLISNAIKFSNRDTTIQIYIERHDNQIITTVRDQGQGIPKSEIDNLFKFFQTTSVKSTAGEKSTGLGLQITHKIIDAHQGKIWVESVVNQGSTFCFSLPLTDNNAIPQNAKN